MSGQRTIPLLFVLLLLPAVALGSMSGQAILIHAHGGHDTHKHGLALHEVEDWQAHPAHADHAHYDHKHRGVPDESPADDGGTFVIVLELPEALLQMRSLLPGTTIAKRPTPSLLLASTAYVPAVTAHCAHPPHRPAAPNLRAGSAVGNLLLTNHALLL